MDDSTIWWLVVGACVVVEMLTGTFYLLMLALGFVAAALLAHLGMAVATQVAAAALVGGGAAALLYAVRRRRPASASAQSNPDVNLDIGELLTVEHWNPDGTAFVHYRGARWSVMQRGTADPAPGLHRVVAVVGNRLMVDKA